MRGSCQLRRRPPLTSGDAYAYEALVRGPNGESAASVLSLVDDANRYRFDQRCRTTAIAQAAAIGMESFLSINFMPNAVYQPAACIRTTFEAAEKYGFPINRIIFETIEGENIINRPHLLQIFRTYKSFGFQTAIDDFGAGYSGLTLLAEFQPDLIKLDMALVRGIDEDHVRQRIARGVLTICSDLGIRVIAEEFVIVLANCTRVNAIELGERIRHNVNVYQDTEVAALTLSLGLAMLAPDETIDQLIARADAALYEAKRRGRNRLSISEKEGKTPLGSQLS